MNFTVRISTLRQQASKLLRRTELTQSEHICEAEITWGQFFCVNFSIWSCPSGLCKEKLRSNKNAKKVEKEYHQTSEGEDNFLT